MDECIGRPLCACCLLRCCWIATRHRSGGAAAGHQSGGAHPLAIELLDSFDEMELLKTAVKILRAAGVLELLDSSWKMKNAGQRDETTVAGSASPIVVLSIRPLLAIGRHAAVVGEDAGTGGRLRSRWIWHARFITGALDGLDQALGASPVVVFAIGWEDAAAATEMARMLSASARTHRIWKRRASWSFCPAPIGGLPLAGRSPAVPGGDDGAP
ncbi:hypothetical protein ACLOJK_029808 [Asimina triloba]